MEKQGSGEREPRPVSFHSPTSIFRFLAWWVRQVSGDAAYENYLHSSGRRRECVHSGGTMTREEFYLDHLRRRYTGVSRCC